MRRGRGSRSDARSRWREVRASRKRRRYNDDETFCFGFSFLFVLRWGPTCGARRDVMTRTFDTLRHTCIAVQSIRDYISPLTSSELRAPCSATHPTLHEAPDVDVSCTQARSTKFTDKRQSRVVTVHVGLLTHRIERVWIPHIASSATSSEPLFTSNPTNRTVRRCTRNKRVRFVGGCT